MGLKETFKGAAQTIFTAFGNVATAATYNSKSAGTYSPTTGANTVTTTEYAVEMIFDAFSSFDVDNETVLITDKKAMIPVDNLTPTPVIRRDTISISGVEWEIIREMGDPADALYVFHIRRPGS